MKSIFVAATITAFAATGAAAEGLGIGGSAEVEYSIENEAWAMEAGPDLTVGGIALAPRAYASIADSTISFDGVGVEAEYGVGTTGLSVYGAVQTDGDFEYSDAQVGVRFSF